MANNKIIMPDGTSQKRLYDKAIVMESRFQERYEEMLMHDTREGMVLVYVINQMNEQGELISDLNTIAEALRFSKASVTRAIRVLKDKYNDIVAIGKFHGISKFTVDTNRCFKA